MIETIAKILRQSDSRQQIPGAQRPAVPAAPTDADAARTDTGCRRCCAPFTCTYTDRHRHKAFCSNRQETTVTVTVHSEC